MQANSSWLPTLHSTHLFATRRSIFLLLEGFFYNTRWERAVVEVFCVNRGTLIIALIWKVWVKKILKIYPLQVAIFTCNFLGIYELRLPLTLKIKMIRSVRSSKIGNKTNFSEDFIEIEIQWSATDEADWFSHSLVLCSRKKNFLYVVMTQILEQKKPRIHYKSNSNFCQTRDFFTLSHNLQYVFHKLVTRNF